MTRVEYLRNAGNIPICTNYLPHVLWVTFSLESVRGVPGVPGPHKYLEILCSVYHMWCGLNFFFWGGGGSFAKLREVTISLVMSVCLSVFPHGTTRLPLGGT